MRKSPNVGIVLACLGSGRLFHACGDNETHSDETEAIPGTNCFIVSGVYFK